MSNSLLLLDNVSSSASIKYRSGEHTVKIVETKDGSDESLIIELHNDYADEPLASFKIMND